MEPPATGAEARAFLAAIVDSSNDAIVGKDLNGIVRSWNPAAERMFGYTADEMIGRSITVLIPPDRLHEEEMILARLRRGERIEHFETVRRAKDGRELFISLSISPIRDASGTVVGASKIARDVTARREVEASLRESEERFRTLADNIAQFAWMADETGSIFWYNRRWFDYTGTTLEEMKGWGWTKVHHPDHVDRVVERFGAAVRAGRVWEDTFPLRGADGSYGWFLSRALPIHDDAGNVVRWFGTNTDITERMQMEEALRESNERKDHFLATLAHELRNPLAPILTGIELLRVADDDPIVRERVIDTLERQSGQLVRLVDDLLDVSRITRGKVELRREDVDLAAVVASAVETSRPLVEAGGHTVTVDVPDGLYLNADPIRLAQIVSNLLNNAAKYTHEPGRITLSAQRIGDDVEIAVSDTGIGLAADALGEVFEPFFQVAKPGSASSAGLGIGLTLVRSLVELHGGAIAAESEGLGRGSRFVVRLPGLAPAAARAAADVGESSPEPMRLTVLIVDDNRDAADGLHDLLDHLGHDVHVAYDGEAALAAADSLRPDVMLLDLGMPELDGFGVAKRVRAKSWGRDLTLVALTGWGQARDRDRTTAAGFDAHIVKPAKVADLREVFERVSRRSAGASP